MSINKPGNGENPKKNSTILGNFKKRIKDVFSAPNNEEAWNKFSPEEQQEMIKSLEEMNNIDLYSIDLSQICKTEFSMSEGEIPEFKEGEVMKDKIGNYIEINGMKCREWQPGISGFTYENINDRYNRFSRLKVGFCDKGVFKKEIIIDDMGSIPSFNLPNNLVEELGGPFYEMDYQIKEGPLANINWNDIYMHNFAHDELNIRELADSRYTPRPYNHSENWQENDDGSVLNINGTVFKPFEKGISGFVYKEISDNDGDKIFIAEYKDGKMIGEGLVLNPIKKTCIISKK